MTDTEDPIPPEPKYPPAASVAGIAIQVAPVAAPGPRTAPDHEIVADVADVDMAEMNGLMRFFGVEEPIVGKKGLIKFLRSIGVKCGREAITRLIAQDRHLRSHTPQRAQIFHIKDLVGFVRKLTRASLEEILDEEKQKRVHTAVSVEARALRSMNSLFVGYSVQRSTSTFTPLVGSKRMYATHNHWTAREWFFQEFTDPNLLLVHYTSSAEVMPGIGTRERIARAPVFVGEVPPVLAYYRVKGGRPVFATVPAKLAGYEWTKFDVPAVIPLNHPKRIEIVEYLLGRSEQCWALLWTKGLPVGIGTLEPQPETEIQREIAGDLMGPRRAYGR